MSEWMSLPVHVYNIYIHAKRNTALKNIIDLKIMVKNNQRTPEEWEDQSVNTVTSDH